MNKNEPCKNCKKRLTGERIKSCHDTCPEYLATKKPPWKQSHIDEYMRDKSLMLKAKYGRRRS